MPRDPFGGVFDLPGEQKRKSRRTQIVKLGSDKCVFCGKSESAVGSLDQAHILAGSKGGKVVVMLCPNCHRRYDSGKATIRDLAKIHLPRSRYNRYLPKRGAPKKKRSDIGRIDLLAPFRE